MESVIKIEEQYENEIIDVVKAESMENNQSQTALSPICVFPVLENQEALAYGLKSEANEELFGWPNPRLERYYEWS